MTRWGSGYPARLKWRSDPIPERRRVEILLFSVGGCVRRGRFGWTRSLTAGAQLVEVPTIGRTTVQAGGCGCAGSSAVSTSRAATGS